MTKFIYDGDSGGVIVAAGATFHPGQEIEVSEKAAAKLRGRDGFTEVGAKAAKSEPATSTGSGKAKGNDALAARQALVARAKELGIPAKGKSDELEAAIAEAEKAAAEADAGS